MILLVVLMVLQVMWGECISGALYRGDFERMARAAGFEYPVVLHQAPIAINDLAMRQLLGNARFCSITYRLFKLPGLLESACEDYGQAAIYKVRSHTIPARQALCCNGVPSVCNLHDDMHTLDDVLLQGTIEGHEHSYTLDESHTFEKGRPVLVCGNTAAMLGENGISHLAAHFQASLSAFPLLFFSSLFCSVLFISVHFMNSNVLSWIGTLTVTLCRKSVWIRSGVFHHETPGFCKCCLSELFSLCRS